MRKTVAIILGIILTAAALNAQQHEENGMQFRMENIDFGSVQETADTSVRTFWWRNTSDKPLAVLMVKTTCACLSTEFDRQAVQPGEYGSVKLVYHQKGHPGKFSHKAFVYTALSSTSPTAVLTVTGYVEPASSPVWQYPYRIGTLALKRIRVNFTGDMPQVERIACLNAGESDLCLAVDAGSLPEGFTFRCEPQVLRSGQEGDLVIGFDPAKAVSPLPEEFPVVLKGFRMQDGDSHLNVTVGQTAVEGTFAYPGGQIINKK